MQTGYGHVTGNGIAIQNLHTPIVHVAWYSVLHKLINVLATDASWTITIAHALAMTHTYTLQSHITHTNALAREEPSLLAMIMCAKPVKAASP